MKKIILSITLVLSFLVAACQQSANNGKSVNEKVSIEQFEKLMAEKSNAIILDVRTPEEFAAGHVKGAVNLNIHDAAFKSGLAKLDKSKPVFVYCKSGSRSADATAQMKDMGFGEVYNFGGGMLAWSNAEKPVVRETAMSPNKGINEETYLKMVAEKPLVLVDFHAVWCGPCKKLSPILASIVEKQGGRLTLIKLDSDENPDLMKAKQIQGIPYLELYKDGKLIWKNMGLTDEATIMSQLK
ncbi:MAG: thioredoxin [Bacteroidia bacterium]|jgi:thioredoxin 1|nr:thioredoxin [Bacteroidia bacterium]MBP7245822.1 thioredoxin [Bacteroidia bacterium]